MIKDTFTIGGEFGAQKFYRKKYVLNNFKNGSWTVSGRYALNLILKKYSNLGYDKIYLPIYNCPSTYYIARKIFKKISFYDLDFKFNPKLKKVKKRSIIILVNYFGIKNKIKNFKNSVVIEDLTHRIMDNIKYKNQREYFASLRKIGVFNFGGWLSLKINNSVGNNIKFMEKYRIKKFEYLNKNKKNLKKEYELLSLLNNEEKKIISCNKIIKQSDIKLLTNKSLESLKNIRKKNYNFLKKNLLNRFIDLPLKKNQTPLFFLIKFKDNKERNKIRNYLNKQNIYCPIFWPIQKKFLKNFPFSKYLVENTLAIPIDHRYYIKDLKKFIKIFKSYDN